MRLTSAEAHSGHCADCRASVLRRPPRVRMRRSARTRRFRCCRFFSIG